MWLPWQDGAWLALALALIAVGLRLRAPLRLLWARQLCTEGAIVATLYATWQRIGELSTGDTAHAVVRGQDLVRFERWVHLPGEVSTQHLALHVHLLIKAANWYYIVGHAPVMGIFLVWLYVRHRPDFARWRTGLAVGSIIGELIQVIPVAPPRITLHGIVDTAAVYGPTVYDSDGQGFAPQLAAFPSLHCVWAITAGWAIWSLAPRRWRWLGPLHAGFTVLGVVITGNHYWIDAIAGGVLVVLGVLLHDALVHLWRRRPQPVLVEDVVAEPALT